MLSRFVILALASGLGSAMAAPTRPFDASRITPSMVRQFRDAWELAERGRSNREVAVLVTEEPDGSYRAKIRQDPAGFQTVSFKVPPGLVAIFHTHPNHTSERPSPQDIRNADLLQVPTFTLSGRGAWLYDPIAKRSTRIIYLLNWLQEESWTARGAVVAESR